MPNTCIECEKYMQVVDLFSQYQLCENNNLRTLLLKSDLKNKQFIEKLINFDNESKSIKNTFNALEEDCESTKKKFASLKLEFEDLQSKYFTLQQNTGDGNFITEKLNAKINAKDNIITQLNQKILQYEFDIGSMEKENNQMKVNMDLQEKYIKTMQDKSQCVNDAILENKKLRLEKEELELKYTNSLKSCIDCQKHKSSIMALKSTIKEYRQELSGVRNEVITLNRQISELQICNTKLESENIKLSKQIDKYKNLEFSDGGNVNQLHSSIATLKGILSSRTQQRMDSILKTCENCTKTAKIIIDCFKGNTKYHTVSLLSQKLLQDYKNAKSTLLNHVKAKSIPISNQTNLGIAAKQAIDNLNRNPSHQLKRKRTHASSSTESDENTSTNIMSDVVLMDPTSSHDNIIVPAELSGIVVNEPPVSISLITEHGNQMKIESRSYVSPRKESPGNNVGTKTQEIKRCRIESPDILPKTESPISCPNDSLGAMTPITSQVFSIDTSTNSKIEIDQPTPSKVDAIDRLFVICHGHDLDERIALAKLLEVPGDEAALAMVKGMFDWLATGRYRTFQLKHVIDVGCLLLGSIITQQRSAYVHFRKAAIAFLRDGPQDALCPAILLHVTFLVSGRQWNLLAAFLIDLARASSVSIINTVVMMMTPDTVFSVDMRFQYSALLRLLQGLASYELSNCDDIILKQAVCKLPLETQQFWFIGMVIENGLPVTDIKFEAVLELISELSRDVRSRSLKLRLSGLETDIRHKYSQFKEKRD